MREAPTSEHQPVEVPGYRVERLLGRGGFGAVYAARADSGQRIALKVATPGDALAAAQLASEEAALGAVGPAVAPALQAAGVLPDGSRYLALELLQPPTLAERLRQASGPMDLREVKQHAAALCDAVGAVHAAGFVHLDLKPQNVFLTDRGVRLIDFGLARPLAEHQNPAGTFAGTAEYASPEQCEERADLDARADIYALGVLLFEMLTGRPPFTGDQQAVREAHIGVRPSRPSQFAPVPLEVEQVVQRALAKDRAHRFATTAELKSALQIALEGQVMVEPGQQPGPPSRPGILERRRVGLLLFASSADAGTVQSAIRSLGAELGYARGGRYAAIFPGEAGVDPVRRAFRAAQEITDRKLAVRALTDLGTVNTQRRPDGHLRYLAPELGREDRYPGETDPLGPLATAGAAEVLADVPWEPVPGRAALLVPRTGHADRLQAATIVQLGAGPLVGRDEVLRALLASATETLQGRPAVATVVADPGHGKTHLAAALVEKLRIHLPGSELLDLRAREPVPGDADETLRALFSRTLDLPPGTGEESGRVRFAQSVSPEIAMELWPAAALTLRLVSPEATRVRTLAAAPGVLRSMAMRAAGEALRARARRRPICLVLDDAQFADDTALDALEYAALAEGKAPLFVCALGRPSFTETRKSFGERAARSEVHRLGPLEPARAAELCRRLLAPAENVPQAAVDQLVQRTQAIPLLLVELIRGLKRDGLVRKRMRGDTWFLATDELDKVPDSPLVDWLAEREIQALPRDLASHARLAAVLGAEFGPDEVSGVVAELDSEGLGSDFPLDPHVATRRLSASGLLVTTRDGGFRFRHALVREAVARSLPAQQRERVHRAAARFYRTTRALSDVRRLPLLARHAAEAGLREEATTLYLQLAEEARRRHAYFDAERSYTRTLELASPDDAQSTLTARQGRGSMRHRIGRDEDALADFEQARALARSLGDRGAEAEIALDAATALDWVTDYGRSRALVEQAEELAGPSASPTLRARLVLGRGRVLFRAERWTEASSVLQEAMRLAEGIGDEAYETLIGSLVMLEMIFGELGRIDDAERVAARAIALSQERGDQLHLIAALGNRRNVRLARHEIAGGIEDLETFMRIGRELGLLLPEYASQMNLSELLYLADDLDRATEHARRAMEIEERHPEIASRAPLAVLRLARIEAYRGNEAKARQLIGLIADVEQRARAGGRTSSVLLPSEEVLVAMVDLATRDASSAEWEKLLERSARESVEQDPIEVAEVYGTWALRRGRLEEARRAYEEAAARASRIPNAMDERIRRGLEATAARRT